MKRVLALILSLSLAFSLAACGSSNSGSQPAASQGSGSSTEAGVLSEEITIKFANYALLEDGYTEFWEGVKTGFEEKYPNITIEWVTAPYGEITNQVINMAGGGDMVDMMFGELDWIPTLEDAGLTVPVTNVLTEEYMADFYPSVLDSCRVNGEIYGLPMYISPFILYYNTELFEQAGLDPNAPPTTYDEMLVMAEALSQLKTADGNPVYPFGQTTASVAVSGASLTGMVYNFGGTVLDENGSVAVGNQGLKDAFTMLKTLDEKGYNPQNSKLKDLRQLFATGQLAMYYDQSWGFNGVSSINPDAASYTASAPALKGGSGNGASLLQGQVLLYMDNGDLQREACRLLTEYMLTEEVLVDYITNITPAYPAKQSMADMELNPVLKGAAGSIDNLASAPFVPAQADLNLELCTLAQAVTVSKTDVETAIANFESAASGIVG